MSELWPSLIDADLQLDAAARKRVRSGAWERWLNNPTNMMIYTGGIIGALLAYLFLPDLIEPWLGGHRWYYTLIWTGVYFVAVVVLIVLMRNIGYARCVYAELRARGHEVCPRCGYVLVSLAAEQVRCPECGSQRAPLPGDN